MNDQSKLLQRDFCLISVLRLADISITKEVQQKAIRYT